MLKTQSDQNAASSWLEQPVFAQLALNWETILFITILLLAIFSRFYNLGARVMSHDESLHTYYSWNLSQGNGFQHTPMMHGTLQFHLIALAYLLFGASDFSARIPAALASIATIAFLWNYRRYLGRIGALAAAGLMLISPYMLYYGRYTRNEAFVALFGVISFWAVLRYLETGQNKYVYWLTAATVLHFTAKETAFIYTAQVMLFLGLFLVQKVSRQSWHLPSRRTAFLGALLLSILLIGVGLTVSMISSPQSVLNAAQTAAPLSPDGTPISQSSGLAITPSTIVFILALLSLVAAVYFLIKGYTWRRLQNDRAFGLLILLSTLVLPQLAPLPVKMMGWDPLDYSNLGMLHTAIFLIPLALISIGIGLAWNAKLWSANAAIFYGIFVVFYTTLFTNGAGFFSGMVGSLGYWLDQQAVHRGSQPWYYYILIQVPVYEYLPALGSLFAGFLALFHFNKNNNGDSQTADDQLERSPVSALALIGFWSVTSLLAYTYAGERMPWLTVHITLPLILLTGWAIGQLIKRIDWQTIRSKDGLSAALLLPVFFLSLIALFGVFWSGTPPFQGKELAQLEATNLFVVSLITAGFSGWGLARRLVSWPIGQIYRMAALTVFALLALLTARTAIISTYINYDNATEYMVYAHSARGVKDVMAQIKDISVRTTDGLNLQVAYDSAVSWPFTWYLRDYRNQRFYGENPDPSLRNVPVIIVGAADFAKIEPVVGKAYYKFEYNRMWWPNQDYFGLTWERVKNALTNPEMRQAIFEIWLNHDFTKYGAVTGEDTSLQNWTPVDRMRLYVRKDIAAQIWNYGVGPSPQEVVVDPYQGKGIDLSADQIIGTAGDQPGQFSAPRDLAVAPDGSIYVADSRNHRIQHIAPDGSVLQVWGTFASSETQPAPQGTFNEPWGVAISPDGQFVYVADTWNHRVQKFTADGQFISMWGFFGQAESPNAFWGPRDVAVDAAGHVFVTDTGNKRVVVFDENGVFITQFGAYGLLEGQFDEPVGITIDSAGDVYVADTWNQRIQVFQADTEGTYSAVRQWEIFGWFGQSLDNKPYLSVDNKGHVFVADPEGYRILEFDQDGNITRYWGTFGVAENAIGLAAAVVPDGQGGVWVSDAGNNRLMHFSLP